MEVAWSFSGDLGRGGGKKNSRLESETTAEDIREKKKLVVPMHELELAIMSCVVDG
jgi:hypothetical protein